MPRPFTWGLGSRTAAATRETPAAEMAWVQGPVRPVVQQGSRLT